MKYFSSIKQSQRLHNQMQKKVIEELKSVSDLSSESIDSLKNKRTKHSFSMIRVRKIVFPKTLKTSLWQERLWIDYKLHKAGPVP